VILCTSFGGETGTVLASLIDGFGLQVHAVEVDGANGSYVHDRRSGQRREVAAMAASPLSRHQLDELYGVTIAAGLDAAVTVLGGPSDEAVIDADTYRRLATDLRHNGVMVVADLSGAPLAAALAGGIDVLKMSHEELLDERRIHALDRSQVITAMRTLNDEGARAVIITCADLPTLALIDDDVVEVTAPRLEPLDTRGAGDSVTAGITAALARGEDLIAALELGTAAGTLNVTRRGLATGSRRPIEQVASHVHSHPAPTEEATT
jgi:1-phosphofructokinase